ncbi:unnamed protein product [Gadus morhua 'NCC']
MSVCFMCVCVCVCRVRVCVCVYACVCVLNELMEDLLCPLSPFSSDSKSQLYFLYNLNTSGLFSKLSITSDEDSKGHPRPPPPPPPPPLPPYQKPKNPRKYTEAGQVLSDS